MKAAKPIKMYLPEVLVNELKHYISISPPSFNYNMSYFYYILHYLFIQHNKKVYHKTINRQKLASITVSNIKRYIKFLENDEFIISNNSYQIGKKSKAYHINNIYLSGSVKEIEISTKTRLFKNINNNLRLRNANNNRLEPFLKRMRAKFMEVDLDYDKAFKWVTENAKDTARCYYLTSIEQFKDKRFRYFKRNTTNNRLDTNLTNLKKNFRFFILGDYISIDLKNSQPFLLNQLIKQITEHQPKPLCGYFLNENIAKTFGNKAIQKISKIHQKYKKQNLTDVSAFEHAVNSGTLYSQMINTFNGNISRSEAKDIMFKVLFSKNVIYKQYRRFIPYEKEKYIFSEVYPTIYEYVKILKENKHSDLSIFLQRLESYIFIDCIAKQLTEAGKTPLTIHDSIIIEHKHQDFTLHTIAKIFLKNFGVIPTFTIEQLKINTNQNLQLCEKTFTN